MQIVQPDGQKKNQKVAPPAAPARPESPDAPRQSAQNRDIPQKQPVRRPQQGSPVQRSRQSSNARENAASSAPRPDNRAQVRKPRPQAGVPAGGNRAAAQPPKVKLDKQVAKQNAEPLTRAAHEDRKARRAARRANAAADAFVPSDDMFEKAREDAELDFELDILASDEVYGEPYGDSPSDGEFDIDELFESYVPAADRPHEFVLPENVSRMAEGAVVRDLHFDTEKLSRKQLKQLSAEEQLAYKKTMKEERKAAKKAKKRRKRSKRKTPIWQIITLIIGLGLLAYPIIADRISAYEADQAITSYTMEVEQDPAVINQKLDEAQAYNDRLSGTPNTYTGVIPEQEQLIVDGDSAFAWIEFPTLAEKLPIYHGTSEDSLQAGVGHLERTSMPIGGVSTHSVLTGHSGMPGSRMFDDIDRLEIGDVFMIHILNQDLAYKVISTEVVWPDEVESLAIQQGKDLVTLITCTPYGVNDHRLLVHAERTSYDEALALPSNNMMLFFNQRTIPFIIAIVLTVLFFVMLTIHRRRRHPLELGVDKSWNGLSDYTDDRRRFIGYSNVD